MAAVPARRKISVPLPARRPAPARRPGARKAPARQPTGSLVLDKLLSGRAWIGLVFVLLAGIVFFNVDLLQMNRDIAATADKAETIKRENARLRGDLARLGSSERIQTAAAQRGLVLPAAGEVRYLEANPAADAKNALARLKAGGGLTAAEPVPPAQTEPGDDTAEQQEAGVTTPTPVAEQPQATTPPAAVTPQAPVSTQAPVTAPQAGQ